MNIPIRNIIRQPSSGPIIITNKSSQPSRKASRIISGPNSRLFSGYKQGMVLHRTVVVVVTLYSSDPRSTFPTKVQR